LGWAPIAEELASAEVELRSTSAVKKLISSLVMAVLVCLFLETLLDLANQVLAKGRDYPSWPEDELDDVCDLAGDVVQPAAALEVGVGVNLTTSPLPPVRVEAMSSKHLLVSGRSRWGLLDELAHWRRSLLDLVTTKLALCI
jgi:hypothetical protein